MISIPVRFLP